MGEAKQKNKTKLAELRGKPHKFVGLVTCVGPQYPHHTFFSPFKDDSDCVCLGDESSIKGRIKYGI